MQLLLAEFLKENASAFSWEGKHVAPVLEVQTKKLLRAGQGQKQLSVLAYLVWKDCLKLYSYGVCIRL